VVLTPCIEKESGRIRRRRRRNILDAVLPYFRPDACYDVPWGERGATAPKGECEAAKELTHHVPQVEEA
jgi:hypothetical protein